MILSNFLSGVLFGVVVVLTLSGRPCLSESWPAGMDDEAGFAYFERKARRAYAVAYVQYALTILLTGLLFVWLGTL